MRFFLCFAFAVATLAGCSQHNGNIPSQQPAHTVGDIHIVTPWATAGIRNGASAAYGTFTNTGNHPDTLLSVSSSACSRVELHEMVASNGIKRMNRLPALPLSPSGRVVLRPGGTHIMLINLSESLRKGDSLLLHLAFARAGTTQLRVEVQ